MGVARWQSCGVGRSGSWTWEELEGGVRRQGKIHRQPVQQKGPEGTVLLGRATRVGMAALL